MGSNFSPLETNYTTPESAQAIDSIGDFENTTPADEEVSLLHYFLDENGKEQFSLVRTSIDSSVIQEKGGAFRQAVEVYYASLGYTLLSVQVRRERSHSLYGEVQEARRSFTLLQGGRK